MSGMPERIPAQGVFFFLFRFRMGVVKHDKIETNRIPKLKQNDHLMFGK